MSKDRGVLPQAIDSKGASALSVDLMPASGDGLEATPSSPLALRLAFARSALGLGLRPPSMGFRLDSGDGMEGCGADPVRVTASPVMVWQALETAVLISPVPAAAPVVFLRAFCGEDLTDAIDSLRSRL